MPSRDEQIARMAAQKAAVEYVKGWKPTPADTTLKRWIDFFYDDIMDLDDEPAPSAREYSAGMMTPDEAEERDAAIATVARYERVERKPKPGDRPLTDDEEAKVLHAIKASGKKPDLILAAIGKDGAENLTVNDSKQIKALLA